MRALVPIALLAACNALPDSALRPARSAPAGAVTGTATAVTPEPAPDAGTPLPLDNPALAETVGRAPRRVDIDQFRASLEQLIGARWTGPQTVRTPDVPSGVRFDPQADLLEFVAEPLGRPNYVTTTAEVLEPTVTFAKLASDAVRAVCAAGLRADVARPPAERLLLTEADATDALPAAEPRIRRNIAALALRLWGDALAPESETVSAVLGVFRVASMRAGRTPLDGWRAVCIDLATDPRFLSY